MNIIFLGPPGSGKGTQAKSLAQSKNLVHVSPGDIFRDAISRDTDLGKQIKSYVESGKLVPDDLVSEVVFDFLKHQKEKKFILDGFPRTIEQAKSLELFSHREKFLIGAVFFFEVNVDSLVKRLSARRQCEKCKELYNLESKPPKIVDVCDKCKSALVQRQDDSAEVINERLLIYEKLTAPVLEYYKGHKGFHSIDASMDIDKVFEQLLSLFNEDENVVH